MPRSLYLHVPFCPSICPYCDFHKMLRHEGLVASYLDRLEREIVDLAGRYPGPLDTVYFGGGTPSHLSDAELNRVLDAVRDAWGGLGALETTLEADPLTFDAERLALFAELGITRLSIGLQSTQDGVLAFLGRLHDGQQGLAAVRSAVESGLRVNVDVMTALEGQDLAVDLRRVVAEGVRHVSVYNLTIEPDTPFARRGVSVDEDLDADSYELAATVLAELGLQRYEVSNHAVPGQESLHNLAYWRGQHYLGVGPGASSYLPPEPSSPTAGFGSRVKNPPLKSWLLGGPAEIDRLHADDVVLERLLTGLRSREGVDLQALEESTGISLERTAQRWLHDTIGHDLLTIDSSRVLRATVSGLTRLDAVLRAYVATREPAGQS